MEFTRFIAVVHLANALGVDGTSATTDADSERRSLCLGRGRGFAEDNNGSIVCRRSKRRLGATDGCHCHTTDEGEREDRVELHGEGYLCLDIFMFLRTVCNTE
jgi:hypothetical protein